MPNRITETPTYSTVHTRLTRWRGKAKDFECVDCGGTAKEWSLNNDAQHTVVGIASIKNGVPYESRYSYDINDYSPRCGDCHLEHDGKSVNEECTFDGCDREAHSKGLCHGHYQQHLSGKELSPLRAYKRSDAA